jgi:hypothetical protein
VIPIAVFMIIDAGTASSSAFQQMTKIVHDHVGIRVHVHLEFVFTMCWKPRSPPEYAGGFMQIVTGRFYRAIQHFHGPLACCRSIRS